MYMELMAGLSVTPNDFFTADPCHGACGLTCAEAALARDLATLPQRPAANTCKRCIHIVCIPDSSAYRDMANAGTCIGAVEKMDGSKYIQSAGE